MFFPRREGGARVIAQPVVFATLGNPAPMAPTQIDSWTLRNVIERLAAIRREKIAMGAVEFEKVTTPEPDHPRWQDYRQSLRS
jgi:hypothetical protein